MHKPCDYHLIYSTLPGPGPMVEDQYPSVGAGSEKDFHGMVLLGQVASVTDDAEHLKLTKSKRVGLDDAKDDGHVVAMDVGEGEESMLLISGRTA
ncbi:hypothetical protein PG987_010795 [Apiospora arundinis]